VLPALDPCTGPIGLVCDLVSNMSSSVQGAASDYVLGGLGAAFVNAAASLGDLALEALDATTSIDLSVEWFRSNVALMATITLPVVVALFVMQVVGSVLRREPGGLGRAMLGVGKALIGATLAIAMTQLALTAVDGICTAIASSAGTSVGAAAAQFFRMASLATSGSPALQMLIGLLLAVGFLMLWGVLLFRKAALIVVMVFAPVAFAGQAWDATRVWTRRWLEVVAALVFSKVVIVVTFVLGASAFSGTGPAAGETVSGSTASGGAELSNLLVGALLLAIAVWSPWLTWRFVHWSGMEAAGAMHQAVAANPISRAAGGAGRTARFATQQAVVSTVSAGAGAAVRAGSSAKAASAVAATAPRGGASR